MTEDHKWDHKRPNEKMPNFDCTQIVIDGLRTTTVPLVKLLGRCFATTFPARNFAFVVREVHVTICLPYVTTLDGTVPYDLRVHLCS